MKYKLARATRLLAAFSVLAALIACGGSSDNEESTTPAVAADPAAAAETPAPGAVQPSGDGAQALQIGQPPAPLDVPIPPNFNLTVATAAEYQIDVSSATEDPRLYLYQGETLVDNDDDSGEGNNAQLVRFLAPGQYSVRVTEYYARPLSAQVQVQQLEPLTPAGALTLGQPHTVTIPDYDFRNRPSNDREASRALTLQIATAGQYTCNVTTDDEADANVKLIQDGAVLAEDEQGFREDKASITHQLQPGSYVLRVWPDRDDTTMTVTCQG